LQNIRHRQLSEVAFSDTDASGWAHFSKILCYVENAEHSLLASVGIPVFSNNGGWPRVKISCDYSSPLRFQDKFEVHLSLTKIGNSSLNWKFQILKPDTTLVAEGEMISVKVDSNGTPISISESERTKLLG
jgi:YbgC/YbaW family acyl-CoA thioester hydrolase